MNSFYLCSFLTNENFVRFLRFLSFFCAGFIIGNISTHHDEETHMRLFTLCNRFYSFSSNLKFW